MKKNKVTSVLIILILAFTLTGCNEVKNEFSKFTDLINAKKYDLAFNTYNDALENFSDENEDKFIQEVKSFFNDAIKLNEENYISKTNDKDTALEYLSMVKKYNLNEDEVSNSINEIIKLDNSRLAYKEGIEKLEKEDKVQALKQFEKVIVEDENYNDAQNKIKTLKTSLKLEILKEIDVLADKNDYIGALQKFEILKSLNIKDEEIISKEQKVKESKEKYDAEMLVVKKQRKEELIKKLYKKKDEFNSECIYYSINPVKLTKSTKGNFYTLSLSVPKNSKDSILAHICYYMDKDWIFINSIHLKIGDKIIDQKVERFGGEGYYDSEIRVGGVTESFVFSNKDFEDALMNRTNEKVIVRIDGDRGNKDIEISEEELIGMKNIIELYNLLMEGI